MSDLRIALVAEGSTDRIIIEAALAAVLGARSFILTQLQPEATLPELGTGWGGVMKWCHASGRRHTGSLDDDPSLQQFDLLILQLDVDVAGFRYEDYGSEVGELAQAGNWPPLPCAAPCPPPTSSIQQLRRVMAGWLGRVQAGRKTVICMPAQSSGTWLAAAVLSEGHKLLNGIECNTGVESGLAILPKTQRIRKNKREYFAAAGEITSRWGMVKARCSQAIVFENDVLDSV